MTSLTTLTTLFYFTTYPHYVILWLRSLRCFTSLLILTTLLSDYAHFAVLLRYLPSLRYSLTAFTTLFYFTTYPLYATLWLCTLDCFNSLLTLTTVLSSSKYFSPRNFSVFIKFVCATVSSLSGNLVESYMLYYPV